MDIIKSLIDIIASIVSLTTAIIALVNIRDKKGRK